MIDTGIWPESAAFAGKTGIPIPAGWKGKCVAGERFPASTCNDKLIGARYYIEGFGKQNISPDEYVSPRDGASHGSHTASTAAGNNGTNVTIDGNKIGTGSGHGPGRQGRGVQGVLGPESPASKTDASTPTASRRSTTRSPTAST